MRLFESIVCSFLVIAVTISNHKMPLASEKCLHTVISRYTAFFVVMLLIQAGKVKQTVVPPKKPVTKDSDEDSEEESSDEDQVIFFVKKWILKTIVERFRLRTA